MTTDQTTRRYGMIWMAAVLLLLPVFYVLFLGPVGWVFFEGLLSEEVVAVYIVPLALLEPHCPEVIERMINAYLDLWVPAR